MPGDRDRSRALLTAAGHADGLTLKALYREECPHNLVAEAYAEDPARAGAGDWDITASAWTPDWFGNNRRAYVQPMFQSGFGVGTSNYGGYHNPDVDALIERALSEPAAGRAEQLWHEADRLVLADAAIVPILACEPTIPHRASARVRNALPMPQIDRWLDAANLWLDPPD